jgi:hypothetical protein
VGEVVATLAIRRDSGAGNETVLESRDKSSDSAGLAEFVDMRTTNWTGRHLLTDHADTEMNCGDEDPALARFETAEETGQNTAPETREGP